MQKGSFFFYFIFGFFSLTCRKISGKKWEIPKSDHETRLSLGGNLWTKKRTKNA